jgi:hypothetical protein
MYEVSYVKEGTTVKETVSAVSKHDAKSLIVWTKNPSKINYIKRTAI